MMVGVPRGATRVLGKSQGFLGLPVRDEILEVDGKGEYKAITTVWHPTPAELARLNNGAGVHVRLLTEAVPPMMVEVGEEPG